MPAGRSKRRQKNAGPGRPITDGFELVSELEDLRESFTFR
jgi:hypothetical protein